MTAIGEPRHTPVYFMSNAEMPVIKMLELTVVVLLKCEYPNKVNRTVKSVV